MKNFKKFYTLLLALCFLPNFATQGSVRTIGKLAGTFTRKKLAIAASSGLIATGLYKLQAPQKSYTPSPEYLAKQEQLDKDHEGELIKIKEEEEKIYMENCQKYHDSSYPRVSEKNYPYAHQWFEDSKKEQPNAEFISEIAFRETGIGNENYFFCADNSIKSIHLGSNELEKLNEVAQKKYTHPEMLSPKDREYLHGLESILFHETYHLLDQAHAHGRKIPWEESTFVNESMRYEEFHADEYATIHSSKEQLEGAIKNLEEKKKEVESSSIFKDLMNQKANTWFWEYEKRKKLDEEIRNLHLTIKPTHPPYPDRIKFFKAALEEKLALERKLAKETPKENEENLRKLLEREPRKSWQSADTPSTARLQ